MYKIYNNEIKITNFLKGGAAGVSNALKALEVLSPYENAKDTERDDLIWTNQEESELNAPADGTNAELIKSNLAKKRIPAEYLTRSKRLNFDALDKDMIQHVVNEMTGINTALDVIFNTDQNNTFKTAFDANDASYATDKSLKQNFEQNLLAYGMNFAHDIRLVNDDGKIYNYDDFKATLDNVAPNTPYYMNVLKFLLTEEDLDAGTQGTTGYTVNSGASKSGLRLRQADGQSLVGDGASDNHYWQTFKPILQRIIIRLQKLGERYPTVIAECNEGFPSMTVEIRNKIALELQGGVYDNLNYILNGGSISTIIRTPNVSSYFESQLAYHERLLKRHNKMLSNTSKNSIMQIIAKLKEHEKSLTESFELIKNGIYIDEKVIDEETQKQKLKDAKRYMRKTRTYVDVLDAIFNALPQNPVRKSY